MTDIMNMGYFDRQPKFFVLLINLRYSSEIIVMILMLIIILIFE